MKLSKIKEWADKNLQGDRVIWAVVFISPFFYFAQSHVAKVLEYRILEYRIISITDCVHIPFQ